MVVRDVQGRKGPLAFEIAFFSHTRKLVPSELAGAGEGETADFEISRFRDQQIRFNLASSSCAVARTVRRYAALLERWYTVYISSLLCCTISGFRESVGSSASA